MDREEAMKILKDFHDKSALFSIRTALDTIIPELCESEGEKIRKALIRFHKSTIDIDGIKGNEIVAWLEKQGAPADINPSEFDLRLNKLLKQFEALPKEELVDCLSFYLNVVQNDGTYYKDEEKQDEQKSAEWREEDEKILKDILVDVKFEGNNNDMLANSYKKINWLKSLKEKLKIQTKQGISKEDEYSFMIISGLIRQDQDISPKDKNKLRLWLKSIKYQSHWKPSIEQMNALSVAVKHGQTDDQDALKKLLEQLKKLTE